VSSLQFMVNFKNVMRRFIFALPLLLIASAAVPAVHAQAIFTLTATTLVPSSVNPGGSSNSVVTLTFGTGFTGMVDLTCAVTSTTVNSDLPVCVVSPGAETGSSAPSLTITTSADTPAGTYQIVVSGAGGGTTINTTPLYLNVTDLTQDYTISVFPTTAIPSPVVAGSVATSTVTVSAIGSYTGTVSLSCLSVSPVVTGAPVCSFDPPTVSVSSSNSPTSMLTLTTFTNVNNPPSSMLFTHPHAFFAFWLAMPAVGLVGLRLTPKRRRTLFGVFFLITIAGAVILIPACNSNTNTAVNQTTPNNNYTFTLSGSDQNGAGPSSTSTATVMLEVSAHP
jgi:hypothetical protein